MCDAPACPPAFFVIGFSDFTGVSQLGALTGIAMLLNVAATFLVLPALIFYAGSRALPVSTVSATEPLAGYARAAEWLAARPRLLLYGVAALLGVSAAGLTQVRLDTDLSHLRPGGGEAERVERRIEQEFGRAQASGMVLTRGDSLDEALATAERVAERLTEVKSRGDVRSFSSITAFLPSREAAERRLRRFASLPRARAAADLRAALEREGFDPAAFGEFFADWLEATPAPVDPGNAALAPLREQHLRQREADVLAATYFEPSPGVSLEAVAGRLRAGIGEAGTIVTGQEIVEREFGRLLALELRWFLACALILNLALLYAAERRLGAALAQLAPTLVALAVTLGIVGFAGIGIGPVNVIVLPLILGLGVDGTVYMNAHIRHAERPAEGAARGLGPLLLAVGTTIVGFGSLAFSRYPALAGLGTLSALGLGISTLTTLLLVPALTPGRKPAESPP